MNRTSGYRKLFLLTPPVLWLMVFFLVPLILILVYSLYSRGIYGQIESVFTTSNFKEALSPVYLQSLLRTFLLAASTAILAFLLGFPTAFYISFYAHKRYKTLLLILIILPFWSGYIARSYSLLLLLLENGTINTTLKKLNVIDHPLQLLFTPKAAVFGLLYNYLPFMILPIYVALDKIDRNLVAASRDLGASKFEAFRRLILPLSTSGILSGVILVFTFAASDYIIPNLLGGSRYLLISNVITNQYLAARNVPLGGALTIVFIVTTISIIAILYRLLKKYSYA